MIAYLDLPLRGQQVISGRECMVIAIATVDSAIGQVSSQEFRLIYVDEDGTLSVALLDEVRINWRFDQATRRFVDVDTGEELGGEDESGDGL